MTVELQIPSMLDDLPAFLGPAVSLIVAAAASSLANSRRDAHPWRLFAWSALLFGTSIPIWHICGTAAPFDKLLPPLASALTLASLALLLEFGRREASGRDESYFNPSFYVPAAALSLAGLAIDFASLMPMLLFVWGLPAFLASARAFWLSRKQASSPLEAKAKALLAFSCLAGGLFFCLSTLSWITSWPDSKEAAVLSDWAFTCAWPLLAIAPVMTLLVIALMEAEKGFSPKLKKLCLVSFSFLFISILIPFAMLYGTARLIDSESSLFKKNKLSVLKLVEESLDSSRLLVGGVSKLLAETPGMAACLEDKRILEEEPKWLSKLLDRLTEAMPPQSLCYLMNQEGICVASSDVRWGKDLHGRSFAFRNYFKDALEKGFGFEAAFGAASQEPGLYASAAIRSEAGHFLGAAVVKAGVRRSIAMAGKDLVFIFDPSGKVFVSNNPAYEQSSLSDIERKLRRNASQAADDGGKGYSYQGLSSREAPPMIFLDSKVLPAWKLGLACQPDEALGAYRSAGVGLAVIIALSFCIAFAMRHSDFWNSVTVSKALAWRNAIMDSQASGVAMFNANFELLEANKAFLAMFELPEGPLSNHKLPALFKSRRAFSAFAKDAAEALAGHGAFSAEIEMQTRNGRSIWCEGTGRILTDMDNSKGAVWSFIDKTLSKQAADLLKESEARYRAIFDNAPIGISVYDAKGPCLMVNAAYSRISGGPIASLLMQDFHRIASWETSGLLSIAEASLRDGAAREMIFMDASSFGKKIMARCVTSTASSGGRPLLVLMMEDQTSKAESESRFREALAKHEQLFRLMPAAAFTVDLSGKVLTFNAMAETITGYSASEIIGQKCSTFTGEPCSSGCKLFNDATPKPIISEECCILAKDGSRKLILKSADLLRDASGKVVGGVELFKIISWQEELAGKARQLFIAADSALKEKDLEGVQKALAELKSLHEKRRKA